MTHPTPDLSLAKQVPEDPKIWVTPTGEVWKRVNANDPHRRQWVQKKQYKTKGGYLTTTVAGKCWYVHRLVHRGFIAPLEEGMDVCHLDGNPSNNSATNLLQATRTVNASHKKLHGTQPDMTGSKHPNAKWKEADAARVKEAMKTVKRDPSGRMSCGERSRIAKECSVHVHLVDAIRKGAWA